MWQRNGKNDYSKTFQSAKAAAERQTQELIDEVGLDEALKAMGLKVVEVPDRRTAVQEGTTVQAASPLPSSSLLRRASRALKEAGLVR